MLYDRVVYVLTLLLCFSLYAMDDSQPAFSDHGGMFGAKGLTHNSEIEAYGKGVVKGDNRITVLSGSIHSRRSVGLSGIKKQIFLSEPIHTVLVPATLACVIPQSSDKLAYIECYKTVDSEGVVLAIKNGTLDYFLPDDSSIEFIGTNKPLFTVYAHLINKTKNDEKES
jgi:hypothetical protein